MDNIGVVILAAGKGTRLGCTDKPKVMLGIGGKPIVSYIVETLQNIGFTKEQIVLVVGFEKEKVKEYFGDKVTYAEQAEQLGTAHAAYVGMQVLSEDVEHVLVLGGDDSAFYKSETLKDFVEKHIENGTKLSLLTVKVENPESLGRVIRDESSEFVEVLEKEQISKSQKQINEISTGTFVLDREWFESIFPNMKQIDGLGELGLPKAVEMAKNRGEKIQAIELKNPNEWFGINTPEELTQAHKRKTK